MVPISSFQRDIHQLKKSLKLQAWLSRASVSRSNTLLVTHLRMPGDHDRGQAEVAQGNVRQVAGCLLQTATPSHGSVMTRPLP